MIATQWLHLRLHFHEYMPWGRGIVSQMNQFRECKESIADLKNKFRVQDEDMMGELFARLKSIELKAAHLERLLMDSNRMVLLQKPSGKSWTQFRFCKENGKDSDRREAKEIRSTSEATTITTTIDWRITFGDSNARAKIEDSKILRRTRRFYRNPTCIPYTTFS